MPENFGNHDCMKIDRLFYIFSRNKIESMNKGSVPTMAHKIGTTKANQENAWHVQRMLDETDLLNLTDLLTTMQL